MQSSSLSLSKDNERSYHLLKEVLFRSEVVQNSRAKLSAMASCGDAMQTIKHAVASMQVSPIRDKTLCLVVF